MPERSSAPSPIAPVLPTRELYDELGRGYDHFNRRLFDGKLPGCLLTLQREKRSCGYFSGGRFANRKGVVTDEIALNPAYFAVTPLVETLQTLVHEMVHQQQQHHGTPGRARYHNEEFADMMERVGLMASSTSRPGGKRTGDRMGDYAIKGGQFLDACADLITEEFQLWYDLVPYRDSARWGNVLVSHNLPTKVGGGASAINANPALAQAVKDLQVHIQATAPAKPQNKSLRSKYSCKGCSGNVWAKPGMQIACLRCQQPFAELVAVPPAPESSQAHEEE